MPYGWNWWLGSLAVLSCQGWGFWVWELLWIILMVSDVFTPTKKSCHLLPTLFIFFCVGSYPLVSPVYFTYFQPFVLIFFILQLSVTWMSHMWATTYIFHCPFWGHIAHAVCNTVTQKYCYAIKVTQIIYILWLVVCTVACCVSSAYLHLRSKQAALVVIFTINRCQSVLDTYML